MISCVNSGTIVLATTPPCKYDLAEPNNASDFLGEHPPRPPLGAVYSTHYVINHRVFTKIETRLSLPLCFMYVMHHSKSTNNFCVSCRTTKVEKIHQNATAYKKPAVCIHNKINQFSDENSSLQEYYT